MQEPNYIDIVSSELGFKPFQVEVVLDLVKEWSTVPFIARYRKERTGNLDEDHIRAIIDLKNKQENLYKAKVTAINGIEEMWKMTPELMENIVNAKTLKEVEEIYKPYKSKKKTKAMIAIEKWFQVVADYIKTNPSPHPNSLPKGEGINWTTSLPLGEIEWGQNLLKDYSEEEILEWSVHIISAEVSANTNLRETLREYLWNKWIIKSKLKTQASLDKLNEKDKAQIKKFDIYKDFEGNISRLKPYQILALNRWENIWILNVKVEKNDEWIEAVRSEYASILQVFTQFIPLLAEAFKDWYDALFKSVENECRWEMNEEGEDDAITSFQKNLAALLLTKPEYGKQVLAIDPWYKAWCKMVVLDKLWTPILFDKIFLHSSDSAKIKLRDIITKQKIEVIVVGNGTWMDETVSLLQDISNIEIFIVNESWASVYSASPIAKEEFPDLDSLDRGTVSIGRRYIDPLSELVKVPVESIWVGMYQHDMPVKKLEEKLWYVVEDVVNEVGINVNTASSYVLNHISGIDKRGAKKIFNHRPYKSRVELKKVLSDKAYEQAAWFLRVPESSELLDNTDIHPEQYELAKYIVENEVSTMSDILKSNPSQPSLKLGKGQEYFFSPWLEGEMPEGQRGLLVTQHTLDFIIDAYWNIWKDQRVNSTHKKASKKVDIDTIKEGDILEWVVRNVVAFWAFVDIGLKNDGLVHISELADEFVKDPMDFVEVGQKVRVKLTGIDEQSGKIKLSMRGL